MGQWLATTIACATRRRSTKRVLLATSNHAYLTSTQNYKNLLHCWQQSSYKTEFLLNYSICTYETWSFNKKANRKFLLWKSVNRNFRYSKDKEHVNCVELNIWRYRVPDKMLHFQPPTLFTNDDVSLLKSACRSREKRNVSFLMCHVWVYFCFPINNLTSHVVVKTSSGKLKREPEQISCSLRQPLSDFYNYETKVW